jgi:uncharacterized integral membrane protein
MKTIVNLVTSLVLAVWVIAIAILSVQNYTPVSLRFLTFQSIQIPFGIIIAFCAGLGMIGVTLLQPLWGLSDSGRRNSRSDDDDEFFPDDDF